MRIGTLTIGLFCLTVTGAAIAFIAGAGADSGSADKAPGQSKSEARWAARLDGLDRALLDENVGYAPPPFTDDLLWPDNSLEPDQRNFDALRGKVVLLQSWTSDSAAGRNWPDRVGKALNDFPAADVQILALHTPANADNALTYLERTPQPVPVVIDPSGKFCDALGIYKQPVNVLIDRNGEVRYAGLRLESLHEAVAKLAAESFDESKQPKQREGAATSAPAGQFPHFSGTIRSAKDIRGKVAPDFHVQQWMTDPVDLQGKVVVIDFWATWCGPCVAAIPHMNELVDAFPGELVAVGISNEKPDKFAAGMEKLAQRNITAKTFHYGVALDPNAKMQRAIQVQGIPHVIVMSSDWVVRWQGHPSELSKQVVGQIVAANRGQTGRSRNRWQKS